MGGLVLLSELAAHLEVESTVGIEVDHAARHR
jgi:hypothetical protein